MVMRSSFVYLCIFLCSLFLSAIATARQSDEFIRGYVTAILETQFAVRGAEVAVKNGAVGIYFLGAKDKPGIREKVENNSKIGVASVTIGDARPNEGFVWFPEENLFRPLIAGPRWPHFFASYHNYSNTAELDSVASVGFGETFSIAGGDILDGRWQAGAQFGVFAIFDMDSDSHDLINADYRVGIPIIYRREQFAALARVYHQSSHLGDEYLLRGKDVLESRENLSYEAVNMLLSYDLSNHLRLYGGGEYIFHQSFDEDTSREDLEPWSLQFGGDYVGDPLSWSWWGSDVRFVAGIDLRSMEEADWDLDVSLRLGLDFSGQGRPDDDRSVRLLFEYFDGHSPNGQFYDQEIEYVGFGIHLNY